MINREDALSLLIIIDQHLRYGHLILGRLSKRNTNRITNTVGKQRTNTYSTLDAALDTITGLGYTQMHRIGHTFALHSLHEQTVGMYHYAGIA